MGDTLHEPEDITQAEAARIAAALDGEDDEQVDAAALADSILGLDR
jgi:hypothetical protein